MGAECLGKFYGKVLGQLLFRMLRVKVGITMGCDFLGKFAGNQGGIDVKTFWVKVMFGYSVEFGKMRLGGSDVLGRSFVVRKCFGILPETSNAQKRLFFETSGDFGKFGPERLSDIQGTNFGQGV